MKGNNDPATPAELIRCAQILGHISKNMEIDFDLRGATLQPVEAELHFHERRALCDVRLIVLDMAERVAGI